MAPRKDYTVENRLNRGVQVLLHILGPAGTRTAQRDLTRVEFDSSAVQDLIRMGHLRVVRPKSAPAEVRAEEPSVGVQTTAEAAPVVDVAPPAPAAVEEAVAAPAYTFASLKALTAAEQRAILTDLGLSTAGREDERVQRILDFYTPPVVVEAPAADEVTSVTSEEG